jgi:5-methylthioadenosine/S-adenosylhomocysteine deaminase
MSSSVDLLITAQHTSTLQPERPFVEKDLAIGISAGKISYVGPAAQAPSAQSTRQLGEAWIIPGLINAHTHLPMTLFRGFSDDEPLQDWLNKHIFPAEARLVNPEFVRIGSEIAALEALLSGTTCVADMYYFETDIADVMDKAGLRAFLGQSVIDFPAPDNKKLDGSDYRLMEELIERCKGHPRLRPMIAPHAPYTCSDNTLRKAARFAKDKGVLLSIHVSETQFEVQESLKKYSKTPVERLQGLGVLDTPSLFAHCVHVTDGDIAIMAKSPVAAIYNPESNMKLGSGAAPVRKMLDRGVCVALGTDGCASNNDLNMIREMDTGAKLQKLSLSDNSAINAKELIQLATRNGAQALGLQGITGELKVGLDADIVAIDLRQAHLQPVHEIPSLIYSLQGYEVRDVYVQGKALVKDHKCTTLDSEDVLDRLSFYRKKMSF